MNGKLRRGVSDHRGLPPEMFEPSSAISQAVSLAGELADVRAEGSLALSNIVRRQLHRNCPQYRPSNQDAHHLICRSGEEGQPYRRECKICVVADGALGLVQIQPVEQVQQ